MVADALDLVEFKAGVAVFTQGEAGDKFYCIKEGTGGWVPVGGTIRSMKDRAKKQVAWGSCWHLPWLVPPRLTAWILHKLPACLPACSGGDV